MTLRFSPCNHQYRMDGKHVTGVTTLIKGGLPAPALMYWSAKMVAEYVLDNREQVQRLWEMGRGPAVAALKEVPWQERDVKAARGTEVHALAERLVHGEQVDVPEYIAGHVEAYVQFLDSFGVVPLLTEVNVGNRQHWYAGRLDLIADVAGERWLLDVKTSKAVYGEVALQLAGYRFAEFYVTDAEPDNEIPMPTVDRCGVIHVRADGVDLIPIDADERAHRLFLHCAFVGKNAKNLKDRVGEAIQPPTTTQLSGDAA